jgi:hypothetical protein
LDLVIDEMISRMVSVVNGELAKSERKGMGVFSILTVEPAP